MREIATPFLCLTENKIGDSWLSRTRKVSHNPSCCLPGQVRDIQEPPIDSLSYCFLGSLSSMVLAYRFDNLGN